MRRGSNAPAANSTEMWKQASARRGVEPIYQTGESPMPQSISLSVLALALAEALYGDVPDVTEHLEATGD